MHLFLFQTNSHETGLKLSLCIIDNETLFVPSKRISDLSIDSSTLMIPLRKMLLGVKKKLLPGWVWQFANL
jgi:hypothetical protein